MDQTLSMSLQCDPAAERKAVLGFFNRTIRSETWEVLVPLYLVLVHAGNTLEALA